MGKGRLEAFSDGVIAIIITIMVLDLKEPLGDGFGALLPSVPTFLNYALSFVYLGIHWNNHHHLLHTLTRITGGILWANLHLLFWLSLIPFATVWMSENHHAAAPTAIYGADLLLSSVAFAILQRLIIASQGVQSLLRRAIGSNWKGRLSTLLYAVGIVVAFRSPAAAQALYVLVACFWLVPDPRIENALRQGES